MSITKNLILIASLGGTISSQLSGEDIVKLGGVKWENKYFESIDNRASYQIIAPLGYSSENATVKDYRKALKGIMNSAKLINPDGILILHGTDSMAFFAQLAVRVLSVLNIPTIITGSKKPVNQIGTDAEKNLKLSLGFLNAAIECKSGSRTFGVVYNDSFTGESAFTTASEMQSADINGDYKPYIDAAYTGDDIDFKSEEYQGKSDKFFAGDAGPVDRVLFIPAVPGFPFDSLRTKDFDAILIQCYHSGTQESDKLISFIKNSGKPCYMAPIPHNGNVYESRKKLEDAGAKPLFNMPVEGAWAEVVLS